jgi:hypothetical protein
MSGTLHQQPQQQAGKAQRLWTQWSLPTLGLRHDCDMQPHPDMAQPQCHAHNQQTEGRFATAGAEAGGPRWHTTASLAGDGPSGPAGYDRPPPGRRPLVPLARSARYRGASGFASYRPGHTSQWGLRAWGAFPALPHGQEAGQRAGEQVLHHPHAVKAAVEQQALHPDAPSAHTGKPGTEPMIQALLGAHTTPGQGGTTAAAHGRGRGRGAKVCGATFGLAAAALVVMGLLHRAMGGQRDHIHSPPASMFAHALGHQPRQERIEMACERLKVTALAGQVAQHSRARGGAFQLGTGLVHRQPGGGRTDQPPPQVPALHAARHRQGQGVERVEGQGGHVVALQGRLRLLTSLDSFVSQFRQNLLIEKPLGFHNPRSSCCYNLITLCGHARDLNPFCPVSTRLTP